MTDAITHLKVSTIPASTDPDRLDGDDWNAGHVVQFGLLGDIVSTGPIGSPGASGRVADAATVYPNAALPLFVGNRLYGPAGVYASGGLVFARLYARPFLIGGATEFDRVEAYIKTAAAGGALANLAVYQDDGGKPGPLLVSTGTQAADSIGVISGAFDLTFDGVVWVAIVAQNPRRILTIVADTETVTGGTFKLTILGQQTTAIAWNASAATVKAAIEALSSVGGGKVLTMAGTDINADGTTYIATFDPSIVFAFSDVSADATSLTGPDSPYVIDLGVGFGTAPSVFVDTTSHNPLIGFPSPLVDGDFAAGYSQDGVTGALPDPWGSTFDPALGPLIYLRAKL